MLHATNLQRTLHKCDSLAGAGGTKQGVGDWAPRLQKHRRHCTALLSIQLSGAHLLYGCCALIHCCKAGQLRCLCSTLIILQQSGVSEI